MQLTLHIINCPEEYTGNKHIEMNENGGTVGRDPSCRVTLSDHNKYISGNHSLVTFYGGTYYLSDTSTNGTFINDRKILKNQPVALHEDDLILMGRYEFSVSLENMVNNIDIAVDIDARANDDDPLSSLDISTSENISDNQGVIEDLFIETQGDDVNSDDPIAHIDFNMEKTIGLLDDEIPQEVTPSRTDWQIPDDFESVHSEFDLPNIIPENWMADTTEDVTSEYKQAPRLPKPEIIPNVEISEPDPEATALRSTLLPNTEQVFRDVERIEPPVQTKQVFRDVERIEPPVQTKQVFHDVERIELPVQTEQVSHDVERIESPDVERIEPCVQIKQDAEYSESLDAFFKGMRIDELELRDQTPEFFNQMGICLRLCLDKMNNDLKIVSSFKNSAEANDEKSNDDILRLMLSLNQQNVLSPSELLQQVLDELDSHHKTYHKAVTNFVVAQTHQYDPIAFSDVLKKKQLLISKRRIWNEYIQHYRSQLNDEFYSSDVLLHEKLKEHYSTILKVENA